MLRSVFYLAVTILIVLIVFSVWWFFASNYSDEVIAGTYYFSQGEVKSSVILARNHQFEQELVRAGKVEHAVGEWRRSGQGGVSFSKEFLMLPGQEREPDGTGYGEVHKFLGYWPSIHLRQYHVLWYGSSNRGNNTLFDSYAGEEPGIDALLTLNSDHTFHQTLKLSETTKQSAGTWSVGKDREISFSKEFLKYSGDPLSEDETATALDPGRSHSLQILISKEPRSPEPVYRKKFYR